jgi:curved DNA-binding protein CbpA
MAPDHPIPVMPALLMRLLDEIGRTRALHDEETDLIEILVNRGHRTQRIRFAWSPALERELMRASHRKGSIRNFAAKHGISEKACYCRLDKMRARKADLHAGRAKG